MLSSDVLRGHLEAILLALICGDDRYGYELFSEIGKRTQGRLEIKEATLYAVLQRLERRGCIESYRGDVSGGGKRRYYHTTPDGRRALQQEIAAWRETKAIIDIFMEPKGMAAQTQSF
ncbi:MAG: PadR family transcriptional regulator [Oscillospiraceae bacterium]|jgi:PadR family transcriptional regulator PadR|nr:PadR family transcriptional regulator [Oscillospiraceae bacterium]